MSWRARLKTLFLIPVAATAYLLSGATMAQTVPAATVNYISPIAAYPPFADDKVAPWKASNDQVGQIGGWRAYAKEASKVQSEANPSLPPARPPSAGKTLDADAIAQAPLPVRLAWYKAVAAQEMAVFAQRVYDASQASTELAKRMASVGNFTRLQLANVQAVHAESAISLLTGTQTAYQEREALIRALGLKDAAASALSLPNKLPDLPANTLPEAVLRQVTRTTDSNAYANEAPSELRSSYVAYRNAYELSRHYRDNVLPLRKIIAEENTLLYNGMFISVFELLADNREQSKAVISALAAQLDFWQAETAFQNTLKSQLVPNLDAGGD